METVARIKNLLIETEDQIRTSGELYAQLEGWGYRNLDLERLHHQAKEVRSRLRQIFHSFNLLRSATSPPRSVRRPSRQRPRTRW